MAADPVSPEVATITVARRITAGIDYPGTSPLTEGERDVVQTIATPPEVIAAGEWLIANPPNNPGHEFYFYSVYYNSQALHQLGGKYWDTVYPKLRDALRETAVVATKCE